MASKGSHKAEELQSSAIELAKDMGMDMGYGSGYGKGYGKGKSADEPQDTHPYLYIVYICIYIFRHLS